MKMKLKDALSYHITYSFNIQPWSQLTNQFSMTNPPNLLKGVLVVSPGNVSINQ